MSSVTKVVCFDLDGTLIQGYDATSITLACTLNGRREEMLAIEEARIRGEFDWIAADYQKAALLKGLPLSRLADAIRQTLIFFPGAHRHPVPALAQAGIIGTGADHHAQAPHFFSQPGHIAAEKQIVDAAAHHMHSGPFQLLPQPGPFLPNESPHILHILFFL